MTKKQIDVFTTALVQEGRTASTVSGYRLMILRLDKSVGGLFEKGVASRLEAWRTTRQRQLERGLIKPSTIRAELTVLRTFYTVMMESKIVRLAENPAKPLRYPKRINDEFLPRPVSREDVDKLFAVVESESATGHRDRCIMEMFLHGLRRIEVIRLDAGSIGVENDGFVLRVRGKGGRERAVPLRKSATPLIASYVLRTFVPTEYSEWLDDAKGNAAQAVKALVQRRLGAIPDLPLFTHNGKRLTERWVNRMFAGYREQAGIGAEHGPHALRHTCGTELLRGGANLRVVQDILGHTDIRTTTIYTKTLTDERAAAVDALPSTFEGGNKWLTSTS